MPEEGETTPATAPEGRTFTQADVDRIVEDRLKRERAKYSDYDDLKKRAAEADTNKSELQKLTETVTKLKDDLGEERQRSVRTEVARKTGLSLAKVERLKGDTEDELLADAEQVFDVKPGDGKTATGSTEGATGGGGEAGKEEPPDKGGSGKPRSSPAELREGTVPNAGAEKSGEELAEEVWKKTRGDL